MSNLTKRIKICKTNIGMIVITPTLINNEGLYEMAGVVPGTYAAELIDRFWFYLVGHSITIQEDYQKYYQLEYPSLSHFLYNKYAMAPKYISILEPYIDQGLHLILETWGRDYQMESLFEYRDSLLKNFMKALSLSFIKVYTEENNEEIYDED